MKNNCGKIFWNEKNDHNDLSGNKGQDKVNVHFVKLYNCAKDMHRKQCLTSILNFTQNESSSQLIFIVWNICVKTQLIFSQQI